MVRLTAALISAIHDGADLTTITSLVAPHRDLDQLIGLDVCERLTRLDLSDNRLSSLEGITLCTKLTWLSVAGNQVTSLKGVENLTKLTVLNASKNEIKSMTEVACLTELRALILNDNEITSVPKLDRLVNLNTIVLSRNPIPKLGKFASKIMSLKKLSMSHCRLQLIGTALKRCGTIEELRLAHNQLTTLPQELERNGRLAILDLGTNHIKSWSDIQVLETLHTLVNLNLRGNPLCLEDGYEDMARKKLLYLQVLDGHNLPGAPKRNKRKNFHEENTEENGAREQEIKSDTPSDGLPLKSKKKKTKENTAGNGAADDSKSKSFLEFINLPSTAPEEEEPGKEAPLEVVKSGKDSKARKKKDDSGVISVVDNTKGRRFGSRVKKVEELLTKVLPSTEIGTGGASTWDDEPPPTPQVMSKASALPDQMNASVEHKPSNGRVLKKKK